MTDLPVHQDDMPQVPCEVRAVRAEDRRVVQRMLELYQHDLSDLWDQDLDEHGEYGYALDRYWNRAPGCHAFVVLVAGHPAGFALVDTAVRVGAHGHWMDQFFVLRKYRRRGVGAQLARAVFTALPGRWEVGQMPGNAAARVFWREVIGTHTQARFTEHELLKGRWQGTVQVFEAGAS